MIRKIRFGDYIKEVTVQQRKISYNKLTPKIKLDKDGKEIPYRPPKLKLRPKDFYRILKPYISVRLIEQLKAVVPLSLYLILFEIIVLRQYIEDLWTLVVGLVGVIIGLLFFIEGLKVGLMPFGESIGHSLPEKSSLSLVLFITFILGIGVTFAEPAIGALKEAGKIVHVEKAPYLYILLNNWSEILVLVVGVSVGFAAVLGTMRFIYGWSLKVFIYITLVPILILTFYIMLNPNLDKILGLAWDCGAVTTGPVTVPLVLSLGIGVAMAVGKEHSSLSGFGIVTLASLLPVLGVMLLALYVFHTVPVEEILKTVHTYTNIKNTIHWSSKTPFIEIIMGVRAIIPLILFLVFVMKIILKEKIHNSIHIIYGIILSVLGIIIFNLGLTYGLARLGNQTGGLVPAAFTQIEGIKGSPLYVFTLGIVITLIFSWFLGFGATVVEPALNAMGVTVETLTNGAFKKSLLIYTVSFGVGCGITLGVCKIIFSIPLAYLLLPGYILAIILTIFSTEEFVNIAWDSAGVTTGPVTVPLVLAMGLGLGTAVDSIEGFGILSMASVCPILSVLFVGIFVRYKIRQKESKKFEFEFFQNDLDI